MTDEYIFGWMNSSRLFLVEHDLQSGKMEKFQQNSYWFPLSCVQVSCVQDLTEGKGGRNKQEMNGLSYNVKVFHFSQ